ncbi:MAG TPA: MFS transporter [Blastocatellia bacterium]|nr:MFS transporter [Blastocatellia bacterium]
MNDTPTTALKPTRTRYKVLWLVFTLAVITYLDRLCISAAAPAITQEFGFTPTQMGYIFSAFTLAYAVFEVPSGWLGDYMGTRKALTRIVLCWSLFTVLTGASVGFWSLITIRFLFGAGEAGAFPNIARTVSRWLPAAEQGRGMSVSFLGLAAGSAIATPLVFKLIEWQGWRWAFVWVGLVGVVWCVIWYRWFRDTPEEHSSVNEAELKMIRANAVKTDFEHKHRVPWRRLFKSANLWAIGAMYIAYGYGIYFYITWLPTYLLKARGFSTTYAGWFSSLPWILSAGAFWFGGWLTDWLSMRTGSMKIGRCGVGAIGYGVSGLALLAIAQTENRILAVALIAVAMCFQMMTASAAWSVCLDVGRRNAGVVTGFMNTVGNIGGVASPMVVGYAVEKLHSWTIPFYVAAGVFAWGVVMWLIVNPNRSVLDET